MSNQLNAKEKFSTTQLGSTLSGKDYSYRPKISVLSEMAAGERFADRGQFNRAISSFSHAIEKDPDCVQAHLYRACLRILVGDETRSVSELRAISHLRLSLLPFYRDLATLDPIQFPNFLPALEVLISRNKNCAWAHVLRSFSLRNLMRYEEAIGDMNRAILCEPKSAALWAIRSRVKLTNARNSYEGVSDIEEALRLEPKWGWLYCWQGEALRHQGEFQRALKSLNRGIQLAPRYRLAYAWRGAVQSGLFNYQEALKDLSYFLKRDAIFHSRHDPEHTAHQKSWAYNQKMLAHRGLGDIGAAIRNLNRAHALENRYHWVFNPERHKVAYEEAIESLNRALTSHRRSVWILAWRGKSYEEWGRLSLALEDYNTGLKSAPQNGWLWSWKGRLMCSLGKPEEALDCLNRGLRLRPDYPLAWGWRAALHSHFGDSKSAINDYTRAIELDYRAAWAYAGRGEVYGRKRAFGQSLLDLDRAIAIHPFYRDAYIVRSGIFKKLGRVQESLKDLRAVKECERKK